MMRAGVVQQPKSYLLDSTSVIDVLSLAAGRETYIIEGWKIVNRDSTDRKVTIWWNDGTTDFAIFEGIVGANGTMWDDAVGIKLYATSAAKKIKAQAAASNVVTVTLTYSTTPRETPNASHSGSGA